MDAAVTSDIAVVARRRQRRGALFLCALAGLLLVAALVSISHGAVAVSPGQVVAILAHEIGITLPWEYGQREETVLLSIRLPRTILGLVTGAALAVSGAVLQGLFRNPLADPALIGVSSGAALAAVATIVLGGTLAAFLPLGFRPYLLPVAAFAGGLLVTLLVYRIASRDGQVDVATMLLAGVALNAMAGAGIGLMVFISTDQQLRDLNFWLLGSLGGVTWPTLLPALPLIGAPVVILPLLWQRLNALLLGEGQAFHLGFDVERTKRVIVVLAALTAGASVALTGVIGFVGLVVPHLIRLSIGPDHRTLLPGAVLLGAALMLIADVFARTVVLPSELPIGVLTAFVGGPFFLWLLLRGRRIGGW